MKTKSFAEMDCSIARSLEQVGSWWSLLIIREALMGGRRFREFEKQLGISKNTLTSRLNELVATGVMEKRDGEGGSAYAEYRLTPKGRALAPVLMALAQWGDRWAEHESGRRYAFVDRRTDAEISEIRPRRENGEAIPLREIALKPLKPDLRDPSETRSKEKP